MKYTDGSVYQGHWQENNKHGFGTFTYPNGEKYEGTWVRGRKNGTGVYTDAEG